jgi:glycosyltransferase involved in cell wall biosynthesis
MEKDKKEKKLPVLYLIAPCYNEENVLPITYKLFTDKLEELIKKKKIDSHSRALFVNDGSSDSTWEIIQDLAQKNEYIEGASLSRNRGHQNALLAGLMEAKDRCDVTITLDCDGQHDINAVDLFLEKFSEGNEVVYGIRNERTGDSFLKKVFSELYYRLLKGLGGEIITNHADYRLVSSRVLKEFQNFEEVNIFLRGMFPLVGFKSTTINYDQFDRAAGKSHYSLSKMLTLAIDGITSLSIKPIRIITGIGVAVAFVSFIGVIYSIVTFFLGKTVPGWASMTCTLCFVSGIQMISLGIIGEYVGKTYMETKHRPRYIISERTYK